MGKLTFALGESLADEALEANALERAGYVDALGVSGARVSRRALVHVDAAVNGVHLIARRALAPVAALRVYAESVSTAWFIYLALVYIC